MKLKYFEKEKASSIKPLTVKKTLVKSITNNSGLSNNHSNNINYTINPKTKITINKTLLWKEQERTKTERNTNPFSVKIKQELKKHSNKKLEFTGQKLNQSKVTNSVKKVNLNSIVISPRGTNDKIINEKNNINNNSPPTQPSSQISHSPLKDNRNNYRFLLHQVSKNLNRTFSKLYEANNRSFSTPNNNNANLIKSGSVIFASKKELSNLGYNINNRGNSMIKCKSNANFNNNLKNKIYENQINIPLINESPRNEYKTILTENNNYEINHKLNRIRNNTTNDVQSLNHKRAFSSYFQNTRNNNKIITRSRALTEENENLYFEKNELDLIIEYLFILENKLKDVLSKLNIYQPCYNECFEWINFYFNSNLYNNLIKICKDSNNRKIMTYSIKIELLCYCLCYIVSYDKYLNKVIILLKSIFEQIHFNFLVLVRFILHKSKMTYENYVWYEKLYNTVKNELSMHLTKNDLNEYHILQIINHNLKIITNYFKLIIDNIYAPS